MQDVNNLIPSSFDFSESTHNAKPQFDNEQMIDCYRRLNREQKRVVRELVRHYLSDLPETSMPCDDEQMIDCYKRLNHEQKRLVRELVRHYDAGWHDFRNACHAGRVALSKHASKKVKVIEELNAACKRMDETRARLEKAEREFLKTVDTVYSNMLVFKKNMFLLEKMMNSLFDSIGRNRLSMQLKEQFSVCCWHASDIDYRFSDYRKARVETAV